MLVNKRMGQELFIKKHQIILIISLFYIATRTLGVFYFAPHNDEVLYTQYAQLIASDWEKYKFISLDGSMFGDYKDPLQFWLTSLTVYLCKNPLIGVRVWSVLLGFCGFFFTQLLVQKIWCKKAAVFTAILIVTSEYYLYFDSIAITEVYVYGTGAAFLYFLYEFYTTKKWTHGFFALLSLIVMLISKKSGIAWIAFASTIPMIVLAQKHVNMKNCLMNFKNQGLKMYLQLIAGTILAVLIRRIFIPPRFDDIDKSSNYTGYLRNMEEIFALPLNDWMGHLNFYFTRIITADFSYLYILFLLASIALLFILREKFWIYVMLIIMWIFSFVPEVILLKGINFARHFGMGLYFWYILLAVVLATIYQSIKKKMIAVLITSIFLSGIAWKSINSYTNLIQWNYTNLANVETPALHWASGIGIYEMVEKIETLSPYIVVIDPQWGHPGTDIEIFQRYYPDTQLKIISQETINQLVTVRKLLSKANKDVYFIFNAHTLGRPWVNEVIANPLICSEKNILPKNYSKQISYETGIVFCKMSQ